MIVNTLWASVVILLLLQSAPHHGLRQSWRKTSAVLPAAACVSSLAATGVDYAAQHRQYSSHLHAVIYRRHSYSHAARTSSTRRQAVSSSGVIDNAKIDQDLLFNFEKRMDEVVQLASSPQLNIDAMKDWDERIRSLSVELRRLPNKSILLQLYESVIAKFAALELDSLQINSYEMLTSAIINALFALLPRNAPMTDLIDDLTDANLAFVETFRTVIEQAYAKVSPSDSFVSDTFIERYCNQYAYLVQQAFFVLHIRSGGDYDPSKSGNNMRVASWVSPIYARLQRRFPKFSPQDIEERHKPMVTDAFMKLLRRLPMEVQPKYTLYGSGADGNAEYPPWQLADLHLRAIRNSISPDDPLTTLETRVSQLFRDDMSKKVQANLKPLSAMRSQLIRELAPAQKEVVEKMLNVGHETVAAVLLVWHIQHNIVGVQQQVASTTNTNNNNNKNSEVMEYVHPLPSIRNSSQVLQGMSKKNREDAIFTLRNALVPYGKNVPDSLKAAALLAYNTRNTASEQYRALSIYNMDLEKSSVNRDGVYIAVLKEVIASALQNKQETFVKETFYEQLVAMSTLEEVIGCREPRASCEEAYLSAVASTILRSIGSNPTGVMSELESMKQRSKDIKIALHLILRLTDETKESDMHKTAFKMAIRKLATEFEEGRRKGLMLFVQPHYEWICNMLDIDEAWAKDYVQTLCITKFDKAISNLLMNADLAISMPDMLPMFEKQLADLGQEVLITPDEAGERVVFLAGLTLYSLLDTALEEFQKSNINRVDIVFKKLYNAFQHPLMKALQAKDSSRDITEVGLVYLLRQDRGLEYVMEVIRMLDALRQRSMSGSGGVNPSAGSNMPSSGWGGAAASSNVAIEAFAQQNQEAKEGMTAFLTKLQSYLLKEFAAGNAR